MRKFQLGKPDGDWSKPFDLDKIGRFVKARESGQGPFLVFKRGTQPDPTQLEGLPALIDDLRERAHRPDAVVGDVFVIRDQAGDPLWFRVIEQKIEPANLCGTPWLKKYMGWVNANFPGTAYWGGYASRGIGSTATPSQHAACPPNAADVHGTAHDMGAIWHAMTVDNMRLGREFDIEHLIYDRMVCEPMQGVHPHAYDVPPGGSPHTDHVHADGHPQKPPHYGGCSC